MRGDQAKWVWTWAHNIFSCLLDVILHLMSYILQKTPFKWDVSFQSHDLLKGCQNNRKQKHSFPLFGSISKSIFVNSNLFCVIIPHIITFKVMTNLKKKVHWFFVFLAGLKFVLDFNTKVKIEVEVCGNTHFGCVLLNLLLGWNSWLGYISKSVVTTACIFYFEWAPRASPRQRLQWLVVHISLQAST